jgi:hypothetical protein
MALEEELRILRQDMGYIKVVLGELGEDPVLTSDEEGIRAYKPVECTNLR